MKWKIIRLFRPDIAFFMPIERFNKKGNLISRNSSYMFFEDEELYKLVGDYLGPDAKIKKSTAKINIESISIIEDYEYNLEVVE